MKTNLLISFAIVFALSISLLSCSEKKEAKTPELLGELVFNSIKDNDIEAYTSFFGTKDDYLAILKKSSYDEEKKKEYSAEADEQTNELKSKIKSVMIDIEGVCDAHHIHIWAISSTINALTAQIIIDEEQAKNWEKIKNEIKNKLSCMNIQHITLEPESSSEECEIQECE